MRKMRRPGINPRPFSCKEITCRQYGNPYSATQMSKHSITVTPEEISQLNLSKNALTSIKYDGVHAKWDGKKLTTKTGKEINAPDWFIWQLPDFPVEGELWMGNESFNLCQSVVMSEKPDDRWYTVFYKIFEKPEGSVISQRGFVGEVQQFKFPARYLSQFADSIIESSGEGLVIKDGDRTIIVKPSQKANAIVVG